MYTREQLTAQYVDLVLDYFPWDWTVVGVEELANEMSLEELANAVEHFHEIAADFG